MEYVITPRNPKEPRDYARRRRIPFRITAMDAPTSAAMAIHRVATPAAARPWILSFRRVTLAESSAYRPVAAQSP